MGTARGDDAPGGGGLATVSRWLAWAVAGWVLWLVMAGSLSTSELVAGAGVAMIAATAVSLARDDRVGTGRLLAGTGQIWWALLSVPRDLWRLTRVLGRELTRRPAL